MRVHGRIPSSSKMHIKPWPWGCVRFMQSKTSRFTTLNGALIYWDEKMIARLPDCLRPRGWEDIRELKVGGRVGEDGEHWCSRSSVSFLGESRKTGDMTLKIKDPSVCVYECKSIDKKKRSGTTGETNTFIGDLLTNYSIHSHVNCMNLIKLYTHMVNCSQVFKY